MCCYCRSLFVESAQLKEHTDLAHREIRIRDINIRTYRRGRIKLDISELWCTRCETQFDTFEDYLDHLSLHGLIFNKETSQSFDCFHLADDGMCCLQCGQFFQYFGQLLLHTYKYHIEKFLCEFCGRSYAGKHNVLNHVRKVHGVKSCKDCKEIFTTHYALMNHVENVHRTDKLQCPMCPKILRNRDLKNSHMALVHDCESAQFVCEFCSKIFTRKDRYVQHKHRVHFKEKNCTCEVCGYKTFNMTSLKSHMVCHFDSRPFKCEICDRTFRRKTALAIHMRTQHKFEDAITETHTDSE